MFRRKKVVADVAVIEDPHAKEFGDKYKVVFKLEGHTHRHYEMLEWVNNNTVGSADVRFIDSSVYFAFENESDATFFKIKYSV